MTQARRGDLCDRSIPATGELLKEYPEHGPAQVERALSSAEDAFYAWRAVPTEERAQVLRRVASALDEDRERHARLMALEMGKPIVQARAEAEKCALAARHYADRAVAYLAPEPIATEAAASYVRCDPLGPLLAVMPWNFPYWQVFRAACPALMAGNVVLLKHASNVPGCALAIEEAFRQAGLPDGCFTTLLVGSAAVDALIDDQRIAAVTLTGSEDAGGKVAARAGARLKKTVLELGGSDAFVVLADADVARAAQVASMARLINAGQSCIAAKRFIVEARVAEEFTARSCANMALSHTRASAWAWSVSRPGSAATSISARRFPSRRRSSGCIRRRVEERGERKEERGEKEEERAWERWLAPGSFFRLCGSSAVEAV